MVWVSKVPIIYLNKEVMIINMKQILKESTSNIDKVSFIIITNYGSNYNGFAMKYFHFYYVTHFLVEI